MVPEYILGNRTHVTIITLLYSLVWFGLVCYNIPTLISAYPMYDFHDILNIRIFKVTIETILLYGSETWTINNSLEKRINGCYTKLLRMVLNVER